jgi:beta-glucanase (GH16 family)
VAMKSRRTLQRHSVFLALPIAWILGFAAVNAIEAQTGWKPVWSDEFNGPAGAAPDPANWKFEAGLGRVVAGNQEAETYCAYKSDSAPCQQKGPNAYLDGKGHLVIKAIKTDQTLEIPGKDFSSPVYTSARLNSLKSFRYGRLEANILVPTGQGVWPSFWGLGVHDSSMNWPQIGEVDIMEVWNPQPGTTTVNPYMNHGSTHGPMQPGAKDAYTDLTGTYSFPRPMQEGFHQFAIEWGPGEIDFYCDGNLYSRQSPGHLYDKKVWEMDNAPFYLLLNLAMGGDFFGYPNDATPPTPTMLVDYVRVYQRDETSLPAGWGNVDIGGPTAMGSTSIRSGVWSVAGSGAESGGSIDQLQMAYSGLAGDGEIIARIAGTPNESKHWKTGVTLRDGRGSAAVSAMLYIGADKMIHFGARSKENEPLNDTTHGGSTKWLKIARSRDTFTGYTSKDGTTWASVGHATLPMHRDILAGLLSTSGDAGEPKVSQFDSVSVTRSDAAWDGASVEIPGVVEAEEFNTGGAGSSYTASWKHQGDSTFRPQEGPAIRQITPHGEPDVVPGGYYLYNLPAQAYANYSVRIAKDSNYTFRARVSSQGTGGVIHFNLDGKPVTKSMQIPDTGGAGNFTVLYFGPSPLPAGEHILSLATESGGQEGKVGNVDYVSILPY